VLFPNYLDLVSTIELLDSNRFEGMFLVQFDRSHVGNPPGVELIFAIMLTAANFVAPYSDMVTPYLEITTTVYGALAFCTFEALCSIGSYFRLNGATK
jgi:hypothetical protein